MTRVRKHTCGAGALLGVLLLAAFAGTALTLHYEARGLARGEALDRAAGRIFAAWFQAAHRASQDQAAAFETTLAGGHTIVLTPARLRALGTAPPGLPDAPGRNATFAFGVIADGTRRGIPMAFGVLEPSLDGGAAHGVAIREGALGSGLAGLDSVGGGALMTPHLLAIEAALGRSLGPGALFVTSDHGLRYLEQALYRRAQPGRAYLNRLETGLDMSSADPANPAGRNIVAAGAVTARAAGLSGDAQIGGNSTVDDAVMAGRLATADLSARELGGAALTVSADLVVGHAVTGVVSAASVKVAGRLDAGGLSTAGTLSARTLSAATAVAVDGEAAVTGTFDGEETRVSGALQAGGIAARAAHGPQARIDVLAAEAVGPGDTVPPSAALLEAAGEARLGLIAPDAPSRLAGPTLDYDVSAFQAAFAGAPAVGALAALRRFDHQAVYGGRLQRLAVPGFPDANRMETDLDMGGNAITGAGRLSAESLSLVGDLQAAGDIAVSGDLTVGQAVRVAGTVEAAGAISADTASFAGVVSSGSLRVNGTLRAASVVSTGAVTAGSVAATGTVTAGSANLERLTANTVSARTVTTGTLSAASVRAAGIRVNGRLDASTAGFSTLIVGRCTGCGP